MSSELRDSYDALWENAVAHILDKGVQTDPHLFDKAGDPRRGLALLARPELSVCERVTGFLRTLEEAFPNQYYYPAASFHITVLSLISASLQMPVAAAMLAAYQHTIEQTLQGESPITVRFHGITASPGAVMIQGFFDADALNRVRDKLRAALGAVGLGDSLDVRYRITTAHMTVLRFMHQPHDTEALVDLLRTYRTHDFGEMRIDALHLVNSDWYMSPDRVQWLAAIRLRDSQFPSATNPLGC